MWSYPDAPHGELRLRRRRRVRTMSSMDPLHLVVCRLGVGPLVNAKLGEAHMFGRLAHARAAFGRDRTRQ